MLASATGEGSELEGITAILLLTDEDDFNALAATVLAGNPETRVYRLAPRRPTHGVIAPYSVGETVFAPTLTRENVNDRYQAGARITTAPADGNAPPATDILFLITPDGRLTPATTSRPPAPQPGDTLVLLGPAAGGTLPGAYKERAQRAERRGASRPPAPPAAPQRIAMGLTGDPVPVGSRSGAMTHKNDHRPASSHTRTRSSNWR